MKLSEVFEIGFISRTHGLKGGLVASMHRDSPLLKIGDPVFIAIGTALVPYFIEGLSAKGDHTYLTLHDIHSIESAQPLIRCKLFLPRAARPRLRGNEFYDDEVPGFVVVDKGKVLGRVTETIRSGSQRMLEVKGATKELLIPINPAFIKAVNRKTKSITVELPDGFLDL